MKLTKIQRRRDTLILQSKKKISTITQSRQLTTYSRNTFYWQDTEIKKHIKRTSIKQTKEDPNIIKKYLI